MKAIPAVDSELLAQATRIAARAGAMTLEWFQRSDLEVSLKLDGSEVTVADEAVEDFVRAEITSLFPDDAVLGEERGRSAGSSGRRWIVDPIDGTASFVRGVPLYSTLLALFDEHGPAIGVVSVPALELTVAAGRGLGATRNGVRCAVSDTGVLSDSLVTSSSFDASWWGTQALTSLAGCGARTRTWGDGYGYALVASGQVDAMVEPPVKPWDIAPMFTIIPEAGGVISGWDGNPSWDSDGGWIASNGTIHAELIGVLSPAY